MVGVGYDTVICDNKKVTLQVGSMMAKKIVIKVGSNLLVDSQFKVKKELLEWLADGVELLRKNSISVAIVTSGAIGVGRMVAKVLKKYSFDLRHKQAFSAIGQPVLMSFYGDIFSKHNIPTAQVLLTKNDFDDKNRYLNIRNTMLTLMEMGVVPVINENDTVATDEIKFGDNDNLSALVASKIGAELLLILTDVEGLYRGDFVKENLIRTVEKITPEIETLASKSSGSTFGTGGMYSKIQAAKIATASGIKTVLCKPVPDLFNHLLEGKFPGTTFLPASHMEPKKCWIAFGSKPKGAILVDRGAATAIVSGGKSLLASGIVGVLGNFKSGDVVEVIEFDTKKEIARGLSYYSSEDIFKIKGRHSREISKLLGSAKYDEVIHRDNIVILDKRE